MSQDDEPEPTKQPPAPPKPGGASYIADKMPSWWRPEYQSAEKHSASSTVPPAPAAVPPEPVAAPPPPPPAPPPPAPPAQAPAAVQPPPVQPAPPPPPPPPPSPSPPPSHEAHTMVLRV